jgi:hypothetical protein
MKQISQAQIDAILQSLWAEGIKTTTFDAISNLFKGLQVVEDETIKSKKK